MALKALPRPDVLLLLELSEDASLHGLDVYLSRTVELCAEWFQASGATLFLREESGDTYRLAARAGVDTHVPDDAKIIRGKGIAGTAIATGDPLLLHDGPEGFLLGTSKRARAQSIGTSIIVPLRTRQMTDLGVLCLSRHRGEPQFSDEDLSVARTLAGQIALAVANARLFAQAVSFQKELGEAKRLAEIGQMTAAIAHEIRNPLTGIRGAAQIVACAESETGELGRIIVEETDKLDRLCEEFLDFARPLNLKPEFASLKSAVERVVEMERTSIEKAGIRLALEIEPDMPKIPMDPLRIEQVCRNLLRNGAQACRVGDEITVRVGPGQLEIRDSGIGISVEDQERLFTPFFTTKPKGTGLGMCVVRKIVEAHGGVVQVSSEKGRGTTVTVRLDMDKH